jgi:hypothetical protein
LVALVCSYDSPRLNALPKKIINVDGVLGSALCNKGCVVAKIGDLVKTVFAHIIIAYVFQIALRTAVCSFKAIYTKAVAVVAGLVGTAHNICAAFVFATHYRKNY